MKKSGIGTIGILAAWHVYEGAAIDGYLHTLLQGVRSAALARGCHLLLACGVAPPPPPRVMTPAWPVPMPDAQFVPVGPWNCDGLIVVPNTLSAERLSYVHELIASGYPVVFAGAPDLRPAVVVDNVDGIAQAIAHLVAHGRRRIAFIAGNVSRPGDSVERLNACQAAVSRHGLSPDVRLIAYGDQTDDVESGHQAMTRILASGANPSALLAYNDFYAIGAMEALRAAGLRVPDDVAVVGFDDRLHARVQSPPLTTVRHPTFDLGFRSLAALLDLMDGTWDGQAAVRIPTRLVVRQSCGCRTGQPLVGSIPETARLTTAPSDAALAQRMAQAAAIEARVCGVEELARLSGGLLTTLTAGVRGADATPFERGLAEVLARMEVLDEDAHIWHAALSELQACQQQLAFEPESARRVEQWLERGHLAISEESRRQVTAALLRRTDMADHLGLMTARLLAALEPDEIATTLGAYLPDIGIRHVMAGLYEPDEQDPYAASRLVLDYFDGGDTPDVAQFITRRFPPPDLYPAAEPYHLALLPLLIQDQNIGFVAFEAANLEVCAIIMRNVAAALRSSQLYHDAAEGRRLAEEANRLKSRFLSTVSHELRTPLNVIVGLSELLLREQAQDADLARQDVERIYASAQHLGLLIRDVLDLASSDAGQLRLHREPLDLVEVLQAIVPTGEQLARARGLVWRVEMAERMPMVWGDRTRLRQVALNFVSNAVKFTPRGTVALAVVADEQRVTVSVSDTGLGIPAEEQEAIFDEFRQSERTATRGCGGLGLGLAISRHLIELHGGEIGVRSSGVEGEGAAFYFALPVMAEPQQPVEPAAAPLLGPALLLTDDRGDGTTPIAAGAAVAAHLRGQGYDVVTQSISEDVDWRRRIRESAPSSVLLDRSLVAEWGWQIVRALQDSPATADVPVVFYSLPATEQGAAFLAFDYRLKPLGQDQWARLLPPQAAVAPQPQTVLVVDDDPAVLDLHARLIARQAPAVRVLQASNGREALSLVAADRPDLILLDLMMPELDGFGVLDALRSREATRDIPVVVLTAQVLTEADMVRLNQGVVGVLEKGVFSADEVLARVVGALARADGSAGAVRRLVRRAMAYLHDHYAEPVTREQVAHHVNASESYLASCFHQELGISPMTYLIRYRIRQARELLAAGELNVTEVAMAVGFADSAYFGRVFQREVGVPPGAYRRGRRPT
jgi:signal transduction histidine kinase/DNA-binding LacI/PurR family transcriptional regulator/AraC-like DNA-binding protein